MSSKSPINESAPGMIVACGEVALGTAVEGMMPVDDSLLGSLSTVVLRVQRSSDQPTSDEVQRLTTNRNILDVHKVRAL